MTEQNAAVSADIVASWRAGMVSFVGSGAPCPGLGLDVWERTRYRVAPFLDKFGDRAVALGWDAHDLFGVDPEVGLVRPERCGALMLSRGRQIVTIDDRAVTFDDGRKFEKSARANPSIPVWEFARGSAPVTRMVAGTEHLLCDDELTVKFDFELLTQLAAAAKREQISTSAFVRRAVRAALSTHAGNAHASRDQGTA